MDIEEEARAIADEIDRLNAWPPKRYPDIPDDLRDPSIGETIPFIVSIELGELKVD